jgi:hypothetical protein
MFVIDAAPTFTRTVDVKVPKGEGFETQSFQATFRVIEETEAETTIGDTEPVKDMLRARIVSMDDLADANGKKVPYSETVREQVLNLPYVRLALIAVYNRALFGEIAGN